MFTPGSGRRIRSKGLVYLVSNEGDGHFDCSWYRGVNDDHLVERASCPDQASAIGWGRARSGRVRIRNHRQTAWVGADSDHDGNAPTWVASTERNVGPVPSPSRRHRDYRR